MKVNIHIAVYVVETLAVRAVHIYSHLPGVAPVGNVPACKRIGGALQFDDHLLYALAVRRLRKVEVPVWRVQYILTATSEHTAEKVLYIHSVTSYVVIVSVNRI